MRKVLLFLVITWLCGCGTDNRGTNPYVKPGSPGTPADRTGGARPANTP